MNLFIVNNFLKKAKSREWYFLVTFLLNHLLVKACVLYQLSVCFIYQSLKCFVWELVQKNRQGWGKTNCLFLSTFFASNILWKQNLFYIRTSWTILFVFPVAKTWIGVWTNKNFFLNFFKDNSLSNVCFNKIEAYTFYIVYIIIIMLNVKNAFPPSKVLTQEFLLNIL